MLIFIQNNLILRKSLIYYIWLVEQIIGLKNILKAWKLLKLERMHLKFMINKVYAMIYKLI